jgi:hypothetical protein
MDNQTSMHCKTLSKMGAARNIAELINDYPQGITIRELYEKYKSIFCDAEVYDEETGIRLLSKVLGAQSEQGLVTRKDGKNCFIYYPLTTLLDQQIQTDAEPKQEELIPEQPDNDDLIPSEVQFDLKTDFDILDARIVAQRATQSIIRHHHQPKIPSLQNANQVIDTLHDIGDALTIIRPDWAITITATREYLLSCTTQNIASPECGL